MDVLGFSLVPPGATVAEVGAGTGNFLALFERFAGRLIAVDLTPAMLAQAVARHPDMEAVVADGAAIPLRSRSIDLVCSAQALHHIREPVPVLKEMRRVCRDDGRVLIVDQVATERAEEAAAMNELDRLRDPSHAGCRPPSAFRIMMTAAGLEIEDEEIVESEDRLSHWMRHDEFPEDRVRAVRRFVAERGAETGMRWVREEDDWIYTRRRIMLLARRGG
ncbi:MAG: class I SAM-dependent methyltransferase [Actinomycetota bacterium]|nr:class I SAM-dependent methyltransferase [Actinomycetota bacterium]